MEHVWCVARILLIACSGPFLFYLLWLAIRPPRCKHCGERFKKRPSRRQWQQPCRNTHCMGILLHDGTQTVNDAMQRISDLFTVDGVGQMQFKDWHTSNGGGVDLAPEAVRQIPTRAYAMTCEVVGCHCTEGQDYVREKDDIGGVGRWANEPIYLCEEHKGNHKPI